MQLPDRIISLNFPENLVTNTTSKAMEGRTTCYFENAWCMVNVASTCYLFRHPYVGDIYCNKHVCMCVCESVLSVNEISTLMTDHDL